MPAAFVVAAFLIGLQVANSQSIILGIKIANTNFGGKDLIEVQKKLNVSVKNFKAHDITFQSYNDKTQNNFSKKAGLEELGIIIKPRETLGYAFSLGRNKNALAGILEQIKIFLFRKNIPIKFTLDEGKFNEFYSNILQELENPAINASLYFDGKQDKFLVRPPADGWKIDKNKLLADLSQNIGNLDTEPIEIVIQKDLPEIYENETAKAKIKAGMILNTGPYSLIYQDKTFSLTQDDIASFIGFRKAPDIENDLSNTILGVKMNRGAIRDFLIALSTGINQEPIDAQLTIKDEKVTTFSLSQKGLRLDIERNTENIAKNTWKGVAKTELTVNVIEPKITENDIENWGITSLIARGSSNFSGSPPNRIHNIGIGAQKFHGVLIKPDTEFSFNTILGEIGPSQGYLPELVIKKDKTIPEYGGGLCQVSTTLFRAAVNSGLQITERFPHSFPVKYYDPQGFDATIYPPHPDLRFLNNTPSNILIQAKIEGNKLTFEIYGTDDGREVKIDGPYEYDKKADGSMKTELTQEVYDKNDKLLFSKTFYSNYKSPNLYPVERNPLE